MGHREELLAGARRCLETRGYARTTARQLVAESGTNLASIGYHFGSKEALLNAALGESFQEWTHRVGVLLATADPSPDPLHRLATSWTAMLTSFAEYRGPAVAYIEALAQVERQPELREFLAAAYRTSRRVVVEMITAEAGALPEAQALASFQLAMFDGLLVQWLLDPDATPSGEQLGAALAAVTGAHASVSAPSSSPVPARPAPGPRPAPARPDRRTAR